MKRPFESACRLLAALLLLSQVHALAVRPLSMATTTKRVVWKFRKASDLDVAVMSELLDRKCKFHELFAVDDKDTTFCEHIKPSSGGKLVSLFPELPSGQILLVHEDWEKDEPCPPPVGFAMYALRYYGLDAPPSLWLQDLFVDSRERSQGAGKALLQELADAHSFCSHVAWKCHVRNHKGQNFYNRMGATVESQKGNVYNYQWVPETWASPAVV